MTRKGAYFEALAVGRRFATERRTVTDTDAVNFITAFGFFEPLFMDADYLRDQTPYTGRLVPGALTFSTAEGLTILTGIIHGTGLALLGVEMKILMPVYVGDTLMVEIEVVDRRETKKNDRGVVVFAQRVVNQNGDAVMAYTATRMIRRRPTETA